MSTAQPETDKAPLAALSLLSLAAASQSTSTATRSVPRSAPTTSVSHSRIQPYSVQIPPVLTTGAVLPPPIASTGPAYTNGAARGGSIAASRGSTTGLQPKARRLSSASQSKRRLNEATAATIQATAASGFVRGTSVVSNSGLSAAAASLSLSSSPNASSHIKSVHQVIGNGLGPDAAGDGMDEDGPLPTNGGTKKKGTIYRCESCSKVYRHPNCLLKHRWEHSPHWREASKFLLSKHQQVQLLEAAAILSHLTPRDQEGPTGGSSLPEDRSLWPSYLSGGLLPAPSTKLPASSKASNLTTTKATRVNLTSIQSHIKKEDSSEEDASSLPKENATASRYAAKGLSSSSLPATSAFAGTYSRASPSLTTSGTTDSAATKVEDKLLDDSSSPALSSTFGAGGPASGDGNGFYFGSIGALPSRPSAMFSPTSPVSNAFGFQSQSFQPPQFMMSHNVPPYARGGATIMNGRRAGHRHTRTSSVSSSYTRSSVRGGMGDEDDMEDDDDDDIGYLDKSSFYGSAGTYSTSVSLPNAGGMAKVAARSQQPRSAGAEEFDFDVLDERDEADERDEDTVDEESDGNQGGAGMEIDMEL